MSVAKPLAEAGGGGTEGRGEGEEAGGGVVKPDELHVGGI